MAIMVFPRLRPWFSLHGSASSRHRTRGPSTLIAGPTMIARDRFNRGHSNDGDGAVYLGKILDSPAHDGRSGGLDLQPDRVLVSELALAFISRQLNIIHYNAYAMFVVFVKP